MRKFIVKTTLYILFFISCFTAIVYMTDEGLRKTEYLHYKEWNELYNGSINADVLIQGSSRAWLHVNPVILDTIINMNSYNLGMDGTAFDMQYARFKAYLNHNIKPKLILQEIGVNVFCSSNLFNKEQYIPYYEDTIILNAIKNINILTADYFIYPLKYSGGRHYIPIGLTSYVINQRFDNGKTKGYLSNDEREFDLSLKFPPKTHYSENTVIRKQFECFLDYCTANEIKVVLYNPPMYKPQLRFHNHDSIMLYLESLATKHNVPFLNYSDDTVTYTYKHFYNSSHLNKNGSEIFSKQLAKDIKELRLFDEN